MRWGLSAVVAAAALALAPAALADDVLTLEPAGGGADTYASWRAQEGLPDSVGAANQALYLHHAGFTAAGAAALVRGVEGRTVDSLGGLEWERRNDSICTVTDPRWTLAIHSSSGRQYLVRFGCATSVHSPGSAPGWTRDTNSQALIRARIFKAVGTKDALKYRIDSLAIVVDKTFGDAWLDNVLVFGNFGFRTWTSAADNGYMPPKPGGPADVMAVDATPWTAAEETPAEQLLASLTPEEQYAITDEGIAAS